jgi:hypothetical protein
MDSALSLGPWQMRMHLARRQAMAAEYSGYAGSFGCCSDLKGILKIAFFLKTWLFKNSSSLRDQMPRVSRYKPTGKLQANGPTRRYRRDGAFAWHSLHRLQMQAHLLAM